MLKYQLNYGIKLSLDTTNAEEYKAIAFTLKHPKAQAYFVPTLQRELESFTGYYGHAISIKSITLPDFVKCVKALDKRWEPVLIEGMDLEDLPISKIPTTCIS